MPNAGPFVGEVVATPLPLVDYGQMVRHEPPLLTIHESFRSVVSRQADAIALIDLQGQMTYGELDQWSDDLAERLSRYSVGPGQAVGVAMARSRATVALYLAILKVGSAYVPLDPAAPAGRVQGMISDAELALVVLDVQGSITLGNVPVVTIAALSEADPVFIGAEGGSRGSAITAVNAEAPANLIFTSGSTGRPKAVVVAHRGVVAMANDGWLPSGPGEVILQTAPLIFDVSTLEIWMPLLNGGTLALAPCGPFSWSAINTSIRAFQVTTLALTSAVFQLAVDEHLDDLRPLRRLLLGGDVLSPSHLDRFLAAIPECTVINSYGPTECTVIATSQPMRGSRRETGAVPIGKAMSWVTLHVVDTEGLRLPRGQTGELWIGGLGVANGYRGLPELSSTRFVVNPFSDDRSPRLYRTGDLVRQREDMSLEFVGRNDDQVKIRGNRIELGEIETVLRAHPAVLDAVAAVRVVGDDKRLAAFFVLAPGLAQPNDLTTYLAERLPAAFVPNYCIAVAVIPLGPTGKADRQRLLLENPEPVERVGIAARSPIEQRLAFLWREVLGGTSVPVDRTWPELGGTSLQAARLLARINREYGQRLLPIDFYRAADIRRMAQRLTRVGQADPAIFPLRVTGDSRQALVFAGDYYDFLFSLPLIHPIWGLAADHQRKIDNPLLTIAELARECIADLIAPGGPGTDVVLAGHCFGALIVTEVAAQLEASGRPPRGLIVIDPPLLDAAVPPGSRLARIRFHLARLLRMGPRSALADLGRWHRNRRFRDSLYRDHRLADFTPPHLHVPMTLVFARDSYLRHTPARDPRSAFATWSNGPVKIIDAPGDHLSLLRGRVDWLGAILNHHRLDK